MIPNTKDVSICQYKSDLVTVLVNADVSTQQNLKKKKKQNPPRPFL